MDNSRIRHRVDEIKFKLRENAATFVLDDSIELAEEWKNLQRICNHTRNDGVFYFSLDNITHCPICDLSKQQMANL